jgi:putative peptidoglycan lipid II flippase
MVRRVVQLFYREIRGLHQAAYVLAFFSFGSQLLAIIRDRALAHTFGAGTQLDLYYTAFRIPDLLFVVFASILSVYVLIPFVHRIRNSQNEDAAANLLGQVFTLFLLTYTGLAALIAFFAPQIVPVLFPAFEPGEYSTLVTLLRVLLLQPFLLGISTLLGVITQMRQRFIIYAISPLLYNLGIIFGITVLHPLLGLSGLVWGVVLGAMAHLFVQLPLVLSSPLRFRPVQPKTHTIVPIIRTAIPRAITLSLNQVVLLALTVIATTMAVGSVSVFQFAFNLQSVPLTIIGVSYSVAAFPVLANLLAGAEYEKFKSHLQTAFRHIVFWSLPVIGLFVVLRAHIVRVTLGSGNFTWDDTRLTAAVLAIFVISLLAQSINLLTIRAFYANSDTRTPLLVAVTGSIISIAAAFVGYKYIYVVPEIQFALEHVLRLTGVPGTEVIMLAVGFALGVVIQAVLMLVCLHYRFPGILRSLGKRMLVSTFVALVGAVVTYATLQTVVEGVQQNTFMGILLQGGVAAVAGILSMYILHYALGSPELQEMHRAFRKRFLPQRLL